MPPRMPNTDWTNSGGLTTPRSRKCLQRVQMADVVAFDLEAGVVLGAGAEDVLDVGEGVLEHPLACDPSRYGSSQACLNLPL